jgi:hypothetical protein
MRIARYAKAVVAALSAGLLAIQTGVTMSPTTRGWVTVGIAILTTLAVYLVPNATNKTQARGRHVRRD